MKWLPPTHCLSMLAAASALLAIPTASHAGTNSAADFTVHPLVLASAPPRIGFNLSQSTDVADITDNAWLVDGCFSSFDLRLDFTATDNGATNGTTFIVTDSGNNGSRYGTDYYNSLITSNAFVGALARVYRFNATSNAWSLIRTGTVQSMTAVSGSNATTDHTITFTTTGAQSLAGDVIWLSRDAVYQNPDISQWINDLPSRFSYYAAGWNAEGENAFGHNDANACTFFRVADVPSGETNGQSSAPPLSIEITTTATSGNAGIWQYIGVGGTGNEQFETGHTYGVSVWLKQSGIGNASATFTCGPMTHVFTGITSSWQQFTCTFPSPGALTSGPTVHLDYTAPGTLYVNQFEFYDTSHTAFTLDPRALTMFQNYNPGTVRIWSAFSSSGASYDFWSLDSWLQAEGTDRGDPELGTPYYSLSIQNKLPSVLALVKQLNANPWLICNMSWSEQEWSNFIDYLAAPAGVGYAAKRPSNHTGPYTADFSKIYLEFGNEEWGTQTTSVNGDYGQYAQYMFDQAIAGKSYYDPTQIKLVLCNFYQNPSFGVTALSNCADAGSLDYSLYTGANDTGDAGFQEDLLGVAGYEGAINDWISLEQQSASSGHPYEVTSYEGGNANANPDGVAKTTDDSLAAAVGQLDVYLYGQQAGITSENFFLYKLGTSGSSANNVLSSHTTFAAGYIPHPVWEAMQMRNQYCSGDIVLSSTNSVPLSTDGNDTPLVGVYTFHNTSGSNNTADVVVISRDLNNSTPVTFHLPTASTGTVNLYTLTGDPRANNDASLVIPIGSTTVPSFGKSYSFTMPPGSIYMFQVPTGAWPAAGPTGITVGSGTTYAQLAWNPVPTATSYNVYRATSPTGPGGTPYATGIHTADYVDTAVTNGTTYYYVVTAVTSAGESDYSASASILIEPAGNFLDINCGGAAVSGTNWVADVDGSGGFTQSDTNSRTIPAMVINPAPLAVYQSLRGGGSYSIPGLTPGVAYTVRIHGDETYHTTPGQRLEDVYINGQLVESALDWFTVSGGKNVAAVRTYSIVEGPSGNLTVEVSAHTGSPDGNAVMSGIEVTTGSVPLAVTPSSIAVTPGSGQATLGWNAVPEAASYAILYGTTSGAYTLAKTGVTGTSTTITGLTVGKTYYFVIAAVNANGPSAYSPEVNCAPWFIAINAGGTAVSGTKWIADSDNNNAGYTQNNGTMLVPPNLVNPAPATVYSTLHAGAIYTIPGMTPGATYFVRLHGDEPYYTSAGHRLADVKLNGVVVQSALDWFAVAGGEDVAGIVTYQIVQPSGSTNLTVELDKNVNSGDHNMDLSGIEVLGPVQ